MTDPSDSGDPQRLYEEIIEKIPEDETRLTARVRDEIGKDLARTRTSERVRTEEGQEEMRRVLLAIAYCMPDVGYCQGMNFIASVILSVMKDEAQGFIIFMYLLINKEMKPLFLPVSTWRTQVCPLTNFPISGVCRVSLSFT